MQLTIPSLRVQPGLRRTLIVRRYIDLPKFLDFLRTGTLYLRRSDLFSDRFEGALTSHFRRALDKAHHAGNLEYNADQFYRTARLGTYVTCWTIGAKDSMALWQLYGGTSNAVAVTSTVERLERACEEWEEEVQIRKVEYIDHFKNPRLGIGEYNDPLRFKHQAYSYEQELRIMVARNRGNLELNPEGLQLLIPSVNELVRSVVVAPESPPWFYDLVADLCIKYGLKSPVRKSQLTKLPR